MARRKGEVAIPHLHHRLVPIGEKVRSVTIEVSKSRFPKHKDDSKIECK